MRYQSPEKIEFRDNKIWFKDKAISLRDLKYVYISGANSNTEYSDNLGCYNVVLRTSHDSYLLLETQDKSEAKKMLKDVKQMLPHRQPTKLYNNSALINLSHVVDVKLSDKKESGHKVKVYMDNGRILRVYRSAFQIPAQMYANTIRRDWKIYKQQNRTRD